MSNNTRPKFVTFIGYFYIMGSVIILFTMFFKQEVPMNVRFNLSSVSNLLVIPMVSIISLVMAYGYLNMKKWGYWFAIIYSILFAYISLDLITRLGGQPFVGNAIWSIIVLVYTVMIRKKFCN